MEVICDFDNDEIVFENLNYGDVFSFEELEKAYLETKSPFFYERIRSFSDIDKVELYIYTIVNKKARYEEATYNKLLKKLKDQLDILKFEQNS